MVLSGVPTLCVERGFGGWFVEGEES